MGYWPQEPLFTGWMNRLAMSIDSTSKEPCQLHSASGFLSLFKCTFLYRSLYPPFWGVSGSKVVPLADLFLPLDRTVKVILLLCTSLVCLHIGIVISLSLIFPKYLTGSIYIGSHQPHSPVPIYWAITLFSFFNIHVRYKGHLLCDKCL